MNAPKNHLFYCVKFFIICLAVAFFAYIALAFSPINRALAGSEKGVVVIDTGHDSYDSGAIYTGITESVLNAQLGYRIAKTLQNQGYEVYLTHPIGFAGISSEVEAILPDNQGQYKYPILVSEGGENSLCGAINSKDPDIAISIHHNSAGPSASGMEVYWRSNGTPSSIHQQSYDLGQFILDYCKNVYGGSIRYNGKPVDDSYKICMTNVPTILCEADFGTNPTQLAKCVEPSYQQEMANQASNAIGAYMQRYPAKHVPVPATVGSIQVVQSDNKNSLVTVFASEVSSPRGIQSVKFPTFIPGTAQPQWFDGVYVGNNTWAYTYNANNQPGLYNTHVYAIDNSGYQTGLGVAPAVTVDSKATPKLNTAAISTDYLSGNFLAIAQGVTDESGVDNVLFAVPVGSNPNWTQSYNLGNNTWAYEYHAPDLSVSSGEVSVNMYKFTGQASNVPIGSCTIYPYQDSQDPAVSISPNAEQSAYTVHLDHCPAEEVMIPAWSDVNGQDDLVWYQAKRVGNGSWETEIPISEHKFDVGLYHVGIYATIHGTQTGILSTDFNVPAIPSTETAVSDIDNVNGTFHVKVNPIDNPPANITNVKVPIWSEASGQSDLIWYDAARQKDGSWTVDVSISNHGDHTGKYIIHAYAQDSRGVNQFVGSTEANISYDPSQPTTISARLNDDKTAYVLTANNVDARATSVSIPVWSEQGGQDDLIWYTANRIGERAWQCSVSLAEHKGNTGSYRADVYATINNQMIGVLGGSAFDAAAIPSTTAAFININGSGAFQIMVNSIDGAPANITNVKVPIWSEASGQSDLVWYDAARQSNGSWVVNANIANHSYHTGIYIANVYATDSRGAFNCVAAASADINVDPVQNKMPIIDNPRASIENMIRYYQNNTDVFPSFYSNQGTDLRRFCQIYYDQSISEGVCPEIAFAQAMKETGWLQFGGDVSIEQYNFAGIGATGGGNPGNSFESIEQGVLAQVQHLKAYATTAPLNQPCVDPRYNYVSKGCAPYVQDLGGKWAVGSDYGYDIAAMVENLIRS